MSADHHGRTRRTSFLDRAWLDHWTVLTLRPITPPDVADLRAKFLDFMASHPTHPLCCTLGSGGRQWHPVPKSLRAAHLEQVILGADDSGGDDPFGYMMEHQPSEDWSAPYKVVVGPDSITTYFAHVTGDAAVFSPFSVLMALGDIDGLEPLRSDAGLALACRILLKELPAHWRDWWSYGRSAAAPAPVTPSTGEPTNTTVAVGMALSVEEFSRFKAWRNTNCADLSATALMAAAAYRALAGQGLPIDPAGFHTLVDLRRHLPKNQALRPGNLAKSVYVPADMDDPNAVAAGLKTLLDTSRAAPALVAGAVSAALRRAEHSAQADPVGPVTMTFNSMARVPGVEHVPWTDAKRAEFLTMSYPAGAKGISVSAAGVEGHVAFSASFDPGVLDRQAVARALEQLHDMPALLASGFADAIDLPRDASVTPIPAGSSRNGAY